MLGIYMREKYLCTNLGVKYGGGHLLEGAYFQEVIVATCHNVPSLPPLPPFHPLHSIPLCSLISFPDHIFHTRWKNGSGQLPILFLVCQNVGALFFSNLTIDVIKDCIPHGVPMI